MAGSFRFRLHHHGAAAKIQLSTLLAMPGCLPRKLPGARRRRVRSLAGLIAIGIVVGSVSAAPAALPYLKRHRNVFKSARAWVRGAEFVGDEGVVLQPQWNLCGAASLKMVLAAHGIDREIPDLAGELRTTNDGASLLDLRLVSTSAGLPARSWILDVRGLSGIPLPAIAFVFGHHFVVIRRFLASDLLEVDDPSLGRLRWPVASFSKAWSGETLVFDPNWSPD